MSGTGNNGAAPWLTYHGVNIYRVPNFTAYFYVTSNIAIDADGAPNAYNPQNTGLDALGNAGYPHGQWQSVLVPDPLNPTSAYVQKAGDPFPGYFVAMTSLLDKTQPALCPIWYSPAHFTRPREQAHWAIWRWFAI